MIRSPRLRHPLPARLLPAGLLVVALATLAPTGAALAQLSSTTSSTSPGSSCSGGNNSDGFCGNSTQELVDNGTTFQSRYAWNINADISAGSTKDISGSSTHHVNVNALATGGYRLDIATSRAGDINRVSDVVNCEGSADTSAVTGSSNIALNSGTLSLGDPGGLTNSTSTASTNISQSASATIFRISNSSLFNNFTSFGCGGGTLASAANNRVAGNAGGSAPCVPNAGIALQ